MELYWKEQTWWDKRAQTGVVGLQSESVALLYLHSPHSLQEETTCQGN